MSLDEVFGQGSARQLAELLEVDDVVQMGSLSMDLVFVVRCDGFVVQGRIGMTDYAFCTKLGLQRKVIDLLRELARQAKRQAKEKEAIADSISGGISMSYLTGVPVSCCPHPVERHAYNGCADCGCSVQWNEHPDRGQDTSPEGVAANAGYAGREPSNRFEAMDVDWIPLTVDQGMKGYIRYMQSVADRFEAIVADMKMEKP